MHIVRICKNIYCREYPILQAGKNLLILVTEVLSPVKVGSLILRDEASKFIMACASGDGFFYWAKCSYVAKQKSLSETCI
jgi:hypothetical protein